MKSFIRKKLPFILIVLQAVLIIGILLYIVPGRYRLYDIVLYDASENVPANPLIGYAPRAEVREDCENTDLVFIMLPFSELEPQEGVFAFDAIEEKYHLQEYRSAGKHAVVRLVCDIPGDTVHRDIPEWLFQKTADGVDYVDVSGKGYAPDYGNASFIEAHETALRKLADWCGKDSFVSYIEMGSIGQNGEWDTSSPSASAAGRLPSQETLAQYAEQYEKAFPAEGGIRLMSSSSSAQFTGSGEWRDVLGDSKAAQEWIDECIDVPAPESDAEDAQNTDTGKDKKSDSAGTENSEYAWMKGPVGGGLTDTIPMDNLLMESLSDTLAQIRRAHVSFIGPVCPNASQQATNGSGMILRDVGYCIYLSRLQTTVDFIRDDLLLHLSFTNIGDAPLYWDWPVTMYVYDSEGSCIKKEVLALSLSELLPSETITVTGSVPYSKELLKGYSVGISICSPDGINHITLAQKGVIPNKEGIHKVYRY